ncbi:DUF1080 domain-containing protein [Zunongwangia sp. F363]|uniref:DUF1080 domain-containing protein n=1 Tax=Autumnicola tepida TaxID=3075595 RepID=A0ABU3CA67_9FLAO|nr:DUF1080 domain-containing protein [Zunongwangia sp. F363]MDT0643238.1 DUF1080 domain-containing protein [Zunongwangia sp. F363]
MKRLRLSLFALALIASGCKNNSETKEQMEEPINEEQAMNEEQNDWEDLTAGSNLEQWKAYNSDSISDQWKKEGNTIVFTPAEGEREGSENLISKKQYKNFELNFEWKISEGGNSGVMWGVQEMEKYNEPYYTGPEIQVLDNERHPDAKNGPIRQAGALYDMVPASEDVTKPAGEWNEETIIINHETNKGSVTLNGTKVAEFPVHGEEWKEMVGKSKFAEWEDFGNSESGHIALQDHGDQVSYRNIKIKELE